MKIVIARAGALFLGSVAVYVGVAACSLFADSKLGADGGDVMWDLLDAMLGADGVTSPVPDAKADENVSGSRLKARRYVGEDGSKQFVGWRDTKEGINCSFRTASDGKVRCLPDDLALAIYFADQACTVPVAVGSCTPSHISVQLVGQCAAVGTAVYTVEKPFNGPVFLRDAAGGCTAAGYSQKGYTGALPPIWAGTYASADVATDP